MADLAVWQRTIVDEEGNVIPGAEVEVRREEDGSLATLYADRAGETPLANPLAADMSGFVRFFAQGDAYTITAVGAGSTRTWRFDPTGRLQEFDRISDALAVDDGADTAEARSLLGTFSTVADVENSHIPAVLESIRTDGYYAPGDGGGALLVEGTSSDPGAIQDDGGKWWKIAEKVVRPQMFGAVGDGITNDQSALEAVVNFALLTGAEIYWPDNTFVSTDTIPGFHSVRHSGPGAIERGSDQFRPHGAADTVNTLYVDPIGSDTNDGLAPSTPFATIQAAVDTWAKYARTTASVWVIKLAPTSYSAGATIDGVRSATQLVIDGQDKSTCVISGSGNNGIYVSYAGRVRVTNLTVEDFPGTGIGFANGTAGVIDTCDAKGCGTGFRANQNADLRILGDCHVTVPVGAEGVVYYRQSTGSWSDVGSQLTVTGPGTSAGASVGLMIRDNSYVVSDYGLVTIDGCSIAINIHRHSYMELRYGDIRDYDIGVSITRESIFADSVEPITFDGSGRNYRYADFSSAYLVNDQITNVAIGRTGPSGKAVPSNYDLVVDHDGRTGLAFLTNNTSGINIDFNGNGRLVYNQSDGSYRLHDSSGEIYRADAIGFRPIDDAEPRLGFADRRWSEVFAATGTINTSDAREKTPLRQLTAAEQAVAVRLSRLPGIYQWLSAIDQKGGEEARLHVGVTAQDVKAAFEAEGLDGFRYGVLCWDEWDAEDAEFDEDGNEVSPARPAGDRYGIRYDELAQWQAVGWNARLEALEGEGNG